MSGYDFLVVGAGLYGSVFAHEMIKKGYSVLVIEKRKTAGGNVYTEEKGGIHIHKYGAHIFHTSSSDIWNYVNALVPFKGFINTPIAYYKGKVFSLPFNMNTFYAMWGVTKPEEAMKIIDDERKEIKGEPKNLEETAISLVGRTLYETLVKGYTEKQWGSPCESLPPFIIKRIPVRFTYDNNYFNDIYQGVPISGYTALVEKLLEGSDVLLGEDFLRKKEYWLGRANKVLYTGCLDALYDYKYGRLGYRSLLFKEERIERENFQGVAVVNYTDKSVPYTRIIEHKHFLKTETPYTYITYEYPENYNEGNEPFYPIGNSENLALYEKYKSLADKEKGIIYGGRLADYSYRDMDKTIEKAIEKASLF